MLEYFKLKGKQENRVLEAIYRLERRRIIKTVFIHFSSPIETHFVKQPRRFIVGAY
jgi:hypothetical protein